MRWFRSYAAVGAFALACTVTVGAIILDRWHAAIFISTIVNLLILGYLLRQKKWDRILMSRSLDQSLRLNSIAKSNEKHMRDLDVDLREVADLLGSSSKAVIKELSKESRNSARLIGAVSELEALVASSVAESNALIEVSDRRNVGLMAALQLALDDMSVSSRHGFSKAGDDFLIVEKELTALREAHEALRKELSLLKSAYGSRFDRLAHQVDASVSRAAAETEQSLALIGSKEVPVAIGKLRALLQSVEKRLSVEMWNETAQIEALLQLYSQKSPSAIMPSLGRHAMDAKSMLHLLDVLERKQPKLVLELGSGSSTVWIAKYCRRSGARLVSVEHSQRFYEYTLSNIAQHGLEEFVDLRYCPLTPYELNGTTFEWYDSAGLAGVEAIDVLVVDGPPGHTNECARYPAVPLLKGRLSEGSFVVLDDSDRPDEVKIAQSWLNATDPSLELVPHNLSRLAIMCVMGATSRLD